MSFNIFKCPVENRKGVPVIEDKHKVFNLAIDLSKSECSDFNLPDVNKIGATALDNGQSDVMGNYFLESPLDLNESETGQGIDIDPGLGSDETDKIQSTIFECYVNGTGVKREALDYCMKIRLTSDTPVFSTPRRLSFQEREEVQRTLEHLLQEGIVRHSESPYASPLVLVRKKSGSLRMCVDYRALNRLTLRDNFPLPVIEDCLEYLGGKEYFSALDLKEGFHQVRVHPDSIKYTAFVTPFGQYEYCYMPYGLRNAPAVFQRFITMVLRPLIDAGKIVVYIDDIVVATKTVDEHIGILSEVLLLLKGYGLKLNMAKCKFCYRELDYLGYRVNGLGIRPNNDHIMTIQNYPVPTNSKEIQRCLGLFSYFRRFVPNFSRIARPLTALTKKNCNFEWTESCTEAFCELRDRLINAPVLSPYSPLRDTELHTDASSKGFGSVLLQKQDDGKFHPVAYYSKSTSEAESKYHSFELETLAVIYALRRFRMFLEGKRFTIVTDCNSLTLTLSKKLINPRIARWALELENYDYIVQHRKGEKMAHVDALSRLPIAVIMDTEDVDRNIQVVQCRDPDILKIREGLENGEVEGYSLENGLVFRQGDRGQNQLYVPREMEDNIIRLTHEKYGHVGVEKCINQIKKHYWFPGMREKINRFIRNCLKCIYYSVPNSSNERNLYNIEKKPIPFDTLHVDHFGPLPAVRSKRKHVLVVIDSFTKFVRLYAVNTPGTKEVCCALARYFQNYSRPRRIISDRASCFTSNEFERFLAGRNISHVKVSVASPQSNGQVERVNRDIKAMLSKLTEPVDHADWVEKLTQVEFAINNTVHSTTKQTPSVMLFGVEQRGDVLDELTEHLRDKSEVQGVNLGEVRTAAEEAIRKSQEYSAEYYKRGHRSPKKFNDGDLVVIRNVDTNVGTNKKFIPRYRGPYVIEKSVGNDRYEVTDVENFQVTQVPYRGIIDSTRLRKWLEPNNDNHELGMEGNTDECTDYEYLEDEYLDYKSDDENEMD